MTTPKTAQQINDPQTGQALTSRHSALSELMIQNANIKEQLRLVQLANGDLDASNRQLREQLAIVQAENARLADLLRILKSPGHFPTSSEVEMIDKALEGK